MILLVFYAATIAPEARCPMVAFSDSRLYCWRQLWRGAILSDAVPVQFGDGEPTFQLRRRHYFAVHDTANNRAFVWVKENF